MINPLSIAQMGIGGLQILGGLLSRPKEKNRPKYEIQSEFQQNVDAAGQLKTMGIDPTVYQMQQNAINRNIGAGMGVLQGRRSALDGIAKLMFGANDASMRLNAEAARIKNDNFSTGTRLQMGARSALAGEKKQKFQWEKLQPFMDKLGQSKALIGAGMQNLMGGMNTEATLRLNKK